METTVHTYAPSAGEANADGFLELTGRPAEQTGQAPDHTQKDPVSKNKVDAPTT